MTPGDLYSTPDMHVWAKEFVSLFGGDEDLMFGWFVNCWMNGWDHAKGNTPLNGDHAQFLCDKRGLEMTDDNPVSAHEAIIDILDQINLLRKRIDDLKEELSILRAGKGEK